MEAWRREVATTTETITLRNEGQSTLHINALHLSGINASLLSVNLPAGLSAKSFALAAGQSIALTITLNPSASGTIDAALELAVNDPRVSTPVVLRLLAQITKTKH